jgi:hypothetical protein
MFGRKKNRNSFQAPVVEESQRPAQRPQPSAQSSVAAKVAEMEKKRQAEAEKSKPQKGAAITTGRFSGFKTGPATVAPEPVARQDSTPFVTPMEAPLPREPTLQEPPAFIGVESTDQSVNEYSGRPSIEPSAQQQSYERSYDPSLKEDLSRVPSADAHEARQAFSNFDQGPLDDVPAFVPEVYDDTEDADVGPPPAVPPPRKITPPEPGMSYSPPPAVTAEEPLTKTISPVQDRWAQIRKNAAERAAQRQSEDGGAGSSSVGRPTGRVSSAGSRGTEDEETSEEESEYS